MARKTQLLSLVILLSGGSALAQPVAQVEDVQSPQVVPVLVPCDEPGSPCQGVRLPAQRLVPMPVFQPKPPWQLRISLSVTSGVLGAAVVTGGGSGPAAYVGGDLRLLWSRMGKRWGVGIRFAGTKSLGLSWEGHHASGDASGAEVGFLLETYNFWFSTGLGMAHYADSSDGILLPEVYTAIGYDIPIGSHFAVRLAASVSSILWTTRAHLGAGVVVRF